jgi:CheY-like chemotaxis protein
MTPRLLIIDDDKELRQELAEILTKEGFTVDQAADGLQGLRLAGRGVYDLILLDLRLPKINGLDLLETLKVWEVKSKILVVTGRPINVTLPGPAPDSAREEERILHLADAVVNKPFSLNPFLDQVRELLALSR